MGHMRNNSTPLSFSERAFFAGTRFVTDTAKKLVTTRDLAFTEFSLRPPLFSIACLTFALFAQKRTILIKTVSNATLVKVGFITRTD